MAKLKQIRIGFSGKLKSGKSTLISTLRKRLLAKSYSVAQYGMSYAIHELAEFGLKQYNRETMQRIGAAFREECFKITGHRDIWVNLAIRKMHTEMARSSVDVILFDSIRYPNELDALKKENFKFIRLLVSEKAQLLRGTNDNTKEAVNLNDPTETALSEWDTLTHSLHEGLNPQNKNIPFDLFLDTELISIDGMIKVIQQKFIPGEENCDW